MSLKKLQREIIKKVSEQASFVHLVYSASVHVGLHSYKVSSK